MFRYDSYFWHFACSTEIVVHIASSELVSKSNLLVIALVLALIKCESANCSFSDLKRPHLLSVEDPQVMNLVIVGFLKLFCHVTSL